MLFSPSFIYFSHPFIVFFLLELLKMTFHIDPWLFCLCFPLTHFPPILMNSNLILKGEKLRRMKARNISTMCCVNFTFQTTTKQTKNSCDSVNLKRYIPTYDKKSNKFEFISTFNLKPIWHSFDVLQHTKKKCFKPKKVYCYRVGKQKRIWFSSTWSVNCLTDWPIFATIFLCSVLFSSLFKISLKIATSFFCSLLSLFFFSVVGCLSVYRLYTTYPFIFCFPLNEQHFIWFSYIVRFVSFCVWLLKLVKPITHHHQNPHNNLKTHV